MVASYRVRPLKVIDWIVEGLGAALITYRAQDPTERFPLRTHIRFRILPHRSSGAAIYRKAYSVAQKKSADFGSSAHSFSQISHLGAGLHRNRSHDTLPADIRLSQCA